jgi:S-adenosylmethionine hydrolase
MPFITFTSDMGYKDHYTAAVKAAMYAINPALQIIDIAHDIEPYNLAHAAYTVKSIYKNFPAHTVHLLAIGSSSMKENRWLAIKAYDHYFVAADNGILSLIIDKDPDVIVELPAIELTSFPEKIILAKAAAHIASGKNIRDLGKEIKTLERKIHRQVRISDQQLIGSISHVDHYGNLITTIDRALFVSFQKEKKMELKVGRETINGIHYYYNEVEPGDCIALFNSNDLLEIAIYKGHASELLGVQVDSPIIINLY